MPAPAPQQRQEALAPASTNATPIKSAPTTKAATAKPARPTDAEIIEVLALHFRVHEFKVVEWLLDMDLDIEAQRIKLAENF